MTFSLGVAPQHAVLLRESDTPRYHYIAGKTVTLHREGQLAYLEAGNENFEFSGWESCELQLWIMRPGRIPGWCQLSLFDLTRQCTTFPLLAGAYEELEWMRAVGEQLAKSLGIEVRDVDQGANF